MRTFYNTSKPYFSKKGQAVVEYILILVVVVTIALALLQMFGKPFKEFVADNGLFGSDGYYACLYEVGKLPGMACDYPDFTPGTFQASNSSVGGGSSGGGSGSGGNDLSSQDRSSSGGGGSSTSNRSSSSQPSVHEWGTSAYTGSPNINTGRRGGGTGGTQSFVANNASTSSLGDDGFDTSFDSSSSRNKRGRSSSKSKGKVKTKFKVSGDSNSSGGSRSSSRQRFITSEGNLQEEDEDGARGMASGISNQKNKNSSQKRDKRIQIQKKAKKQTLDQDDEPLTFGKFIKYVMIIVIVLTILFFIVSRAMEISENLKAA